MIGSWEKVLKGVVVLGGQVVVMAETEERELPYVGFYIVVR
jgi:hypothetical protein